MRARLRWLVVGVAGLCGCTSPNTYSTPRTVEQGHFQHTFAVEGVGFHHPTSGTGALPVLPTYGLRIGIVDRLDFGARLGSMTELGADLKLNFVRGRVDLAVAAGAEAFIEWNYNSAETRRSGAAGYFHFPLIAAYNFSKEFSLVAAPGVSYIVGLPLTNDFARTQVFGGKTVAARFGIALDFRPEPRRAIHPELTILQGINHEGTAIVLGLGFNFGSVPKYEDLGGPTTDEPAPAPKHDPEPPKPAPAPEAPKTNPDGTKIEFLPPGSPAPAPSPSPPPAPTPPAKTEDRSL